MEIAGEWRIFDDDVTRPVVRINVRGSGAWHRDFFLVDTGADRTVLCAPFAAQLDLPKSPAPIDLKLVGVGGQSDYVLLDTTMDFLTKAGSTARVNGQLSAFLDPAALDMNVLGRDVLANFDLILSRRNNEVLLLAGNHKYVVTSS